MSGLSNEYVGDDVNMAKSTVQYAMKRFYDKVFPTDATWLAEEFDDDELTVLAIHHHIPVKDFYETVLTHIIEPDSRTTHSHECSQ